MDFEQEERSHVNLQSQIVQHENDLQVLLNDSLN